jgi:hypothetical protein
VTVIPDPQLIAQVFDDYFSCAFNSTMIVDFPNICDIMPVRAF